MENFICVQCGAQFSQTAEPPSRCPICQDERQFVRHGGQQWTTLQELVLHHRNRFEEEAPQLLGIGTEPEFAIGQRALLVHSPAGGSGKGTLLTGDILTVVQDRRYLSFMRSYPNLIPLGAAAIDRILETLEAFSFDQIYGGWWKANVLADAKAAVARSAERYLRAINASARGY